MISCVCLADWQPQKHTDAHRQHTQSTHRHTHTYTLLTSQLHVCLHRTTQRDRRPPLLFSSFEQFNESKHKDHHSVLGHFHILISPSQERSVSLNTLNMRLKQGWHTEKKLLLSGSQWYENDLSLWNNRVLLDRVTNSHGVILISYFKTRLPVFRWVWMYERYLLFRRPVTSNHIYQVIR